MIHLIPDWTVLIQAVIFLTVLVSLTFLLFRPFQGIIKRRRQRIGGFMTRAAEFEERIKKMSEAYEKKMRSARSSAHIEKDKVRRKFAVEEASIKSSARKEVSAAVEEARQKIAEAKLSALQELKKDIPRYAEEIIRKVTAEGGHPER